MLGLAEIERFDLADHAIPDRRDAWRAVLDATHLPWRPGPESHAAPLSAAPWVARMQVGAAAIVDCGCGPCEGSRGAAEIAATDGDYFGVLINIEGREVLEQAGRRVVLTPGELALWDSRVPASFAVLEPLRKRTLFVPRAELVALCPGADELTAVGLSKASPAAPLLLSHLEAMTRALPTLDGEAFIGAKTAAVDLLATALRAAAGDTPATSRNAGLYVRAVDLIERSLGDFQLTPDAVAHATGVSRRTLQGAFADRGESVARYIRTRRLARAHEELGRGTSRSVTDVALRWGFVDPGHFGKRFKREYGVTPIEVVARARAKRQ